MSAPPDTTDTTGEAGEQEVTSPLLVVAAEGVAGPERGGADVLHVPALQPEAGAASGVDGETDPR